MDVITKNLASGLIKTIGTEKIAAMATSMLENVIEQKNKISLNLGETDIVGLLYEVDKVPYFCQAAIREAENGNTEIVRFLDVKPISELLTNILSKL